MSGAATVISRPWTERKKKKVTTLLISVTLCDLCTFRGVGSDVFTCLKVLRNTRHVAHYLPNANLF